MPRDRLQLVIWSLDDPASSGTSIRSDWPIREVLLSADGRRCVTLEVKQELTSTGQIEFQPRARIWDIVDSNQAVQCGELHGDAVSVNQDEIKLSPGGEWLATKAGNRWMVFATDDARHVQTFSISETPFYDFLFSPSGGFFAVAQGQEVSWWRTDTWQRIEPVCRCQEGEVQNVTFLSEDFLSAFETNHGAICFRRGEAIGEVGSVQAAIDDLLLTYEGEVWRWGSRKPLPKPPGSRFAPEAAKFAFLGRYLDTNSGLVDLETGVVVCHKLEGWDLVPVEEDGLAWVISDGQWSHFPQEPGKLDPRTVELWLQVILRGGLNDADEFTRWDEATWESHRQELARRQVRLEKFWFIRKLRTN